MNLGGLYTHTRVTFDDALATDSLTINGQEVAGAGLERVRDMLHAVRQTAGLEMNAAVESESNFPIGVGIASSASAFAALALAASAAAGLELIEAQLSRLARTGSGSACRSIPGGFVEWKAGMDDEESYAFSIAPPEHWDLVDCIAVISQTHKETGSSQGHALAESSPLQAVRVADAPRRLAICRLAILQRDFTALAEIVELDSNMMHAVMMTSSPRLLYWQPTTLAVMLAVVEWRKKGLAACYTIDAGPNVHVICLADHARQVEEHLIEINGVQSVLTAYPGGPARILPDEGKPQ
jgi:diphosphomevalonate decarboxylase